MPTLPPGRLTFGQIRRFALAKAGNRAVVQDANIWLTQLLYELYVDWTWPFLLKSVPIALNSPQFTLPGDFLQAQDDNAFQIQVFNGQPINPPQNVITEVDPASFFVTVSQTSGVGGLPRIWTADRNAGVGRVYPDPTGSLASCVLRYKFMPTADTTPPPDATPFANDAVVPIFPYHLLLVQGLFVLALEYEQDPRASDERAKWTQQLQAVRQNAMPLRSQEPTIPLDPQVFGTPFTEDLASERDQ